MKGNNDRNLNMNFKLPLHAYLVVKNVSNFVRAIFFSIIPISHTSYCECTFIFKYIYTSLTFYSCTYAEKSYFQNPKMKENSDNFSFSIFYFFISIFDLTCDSVEREKLSFSHVKLH